MQQEIKIGFSLKIVIFVVKSFIHEVSATYRLQVQISTVPVGNIRFIFHKNIYYLFQFWIQEFVKYCFLTTLSQA